jgi:hypothetical protein
MHVHANQINPNIQMDALYAADKAAAQREAARTRKKLLEFASVLAGELGEACVVRLGAHDESGEQQNQENPSQQTENRSTGKTRNQAADSGADDAISDWA